MIAVNGDPLPFWSGADRNEAGGPTGPSAELLALWQGVFLNSHAVSAGMRADAAGSHERSPDQSSLSAKQRQACRKAAERQGGNAGESADIADRFAPPIRVDDPASLPAAQGIDSSNPGLARSAGGAAEIQKWSTARTSGTNGILAPANDERLPGADVVTEKTAPTVEPELPEAAHEPAAAEAVSVFSHGTGIAIVVRDNSLSREEALRCAFETARQLTGRRSTLELLTLNGRILYQQAAASHQPPSSKRLWKMVC